MIEKSSAGITIEKDFNRSDITLARRAAACRRLMVTGKPFDGTASLEKLQKLANSTKEMAVEKTK